jgi:hypothetical protein
VLQERVARTRLLHHPVDPVAVLRKAGQQVVDGLLRTAALAPQPHECAVDHDAVEPSRQPGSAGEPIDCRERGQEGVLHGVPRRFVVAQQAAGNGKHAAAVVPHDGLVGEVVAGAKPRDQILVVRHRRRRLLRGDPQHLIDEARATDQHGTTALEVTQGVRPGGVDEGHPGEVEHEGAPGGEVCCTRRAQCVAVAIGDASLYLESHRALVIRDLRDPHHAGHAKQAACRDGSRHTSGMNSATWARCAPRSWRGRHGFA